MFGYIIPDEYNLYVKDVALYKALYCGLCKAIGKQTNAIGRLTVSYDLTFLSALLHNTEGVDIAVKKEHCVAHPVTKRPIAGVDDLTCSLAAMNVVLAYGKLVDDGVDERKNGGKRIFLSGAYKKAVDDYPEFDKIVKEEYARLSALEKRGEASPDIAADPFGTMVERLVRALPLQHPSEVLFSLCYGVGKWIYLADALDDFEKDRKKGLYNPFSAAYPAAATYAELFSAAKGEITALFASTLSCVGENFAGLELKFNGDLISNVVYKGMPLKTRKLFEKGENHGKPVRNSRRRRKRD